MAMENTNGEFKDTTLEELAQMIKAGFDATASKATVDALAADIAELRSQIATLPTREELIQEVNKLNHAVELNELRSRIERLEEKTGIS